MSFLTPVFLLGAVLVTLPIVLHLLRRDVAPPVPFTAVRLLHASPIERSRRRRLRDLLLLTARICGLLLMAGSFARPFVPARAAAARTTVVAIDRSFSMTAPGTFERARGLARTAIEDARGDRVMLVAFDDRADVLSASGVPADARAALADLRPGFGATRFAAALDRSSELLAGDRGRLVIVSDLQRGGLEGATPSLPENVELLVADAAGVNGNVAVTDAGLEGPRVFATIRNFGPAAKTVHARVEVDGRPLPAQTLVVQPEDASELQVSVGGRPSSAHISIDDREGYEADNERFAVAAPHELPRILLVAGGPIVTSGYYLSRALQAGSERGADFDVQSVTGQAFSAMTAAEVRAHAVVVLLSTHGLDRRAGEALRAFVADGGGLLVAAAPDMDPTIVSTLLDWRPAVAPHDLEDAGVLAVTDVRHPVFRPFEAVTANLSQVSFQHVWQLDASSQWKTLARYSDGAAALLERDGSAGRVLLFTSDVDRRWNDFPVHATFVPFVQETVRYLGARPAVASAYVVADVPHGVAPRPGVAVMADRRVAVNVDPRESAVDRMTPEEFRRAVARTAAAAPVKARAAEQTESRQNYWRVGLMLMLATLVAEAFVGSR